MACCTVRSQSPSGDGGGDRRGTSYREAGQISAILRVMGSQCVSHGNKV